MGPGVYYLCCYNEEEDSCYIFVEYDLSGHRLLCANRGLEMKKLRLIKTIDDLWSALPEQGSVGK